MGSKPATLRTILGAFMSLCVCQGFSPPAFSRSCILQRSRESSVETRVTAFLFSHNLREGPSPILSEEIQMELMAQDPNEGAPSFDIHGDENLAPVLPWKRHDDAPSYARINIHFEILSLDDLLPSKKELRLSETFNSCSDFRNSLREAIRHDMVFDDRDGLYTSLSTEQKNKEVTNNKPLIGLWKTTSNDDKMQKTTEILQQYLGATASSGDELLASLGSLCNSTQAPFHWTEVVGVAATQNKKMGDKTEHAWHQDYGCLEKGNNSKFCNNKHVFWGFPCENNYHGTGVLPHILKLQQEQWIQRLDATAEKPMFYQGHVPEEKVVRPLYAPGREILVFRDVDVLHSTPDIQYRTSLMRFG